MCYATYVMSDATIDRKTGAIKAGTLDEAGRGQWVRDRILDAHPEFRGEFTDYDGNGVVGNIEDFVRYYERNSVEIEREIPFFKWVAKMDPHHRTIHNPIHDYLSLAYDVMPSSDIRETYEMMGGVVSDVRQLHGASSAKTIVALLHQKFASSKHGSLLFLGAAYQFDLIEEVGGLISVPNADGSYKDITEDELYGGFYADLARASDKNGDLERARGQYENAISLDPSYQDRYHRLGAVLHDMEKYTQAIEVCAAALKRDPYDAKAMARRGHAFLALKNIRAARADFKEALQFDSAQASAHIGLGRIEHLKKNYRAARRHYTDAIKADPMGPMGYYWRAVTYDDQKMSQQAIRDYIKAIKRDRSFAGAFHGLALAQHDAGYLRYAYLNLRAAIRRDPSNAYIYKDLGYLQIDRKKPKGALWAFKKALVLNPKLVSALIGSGDVMHSQSEYLKALAYYEKALAAADPKNFKIRAGIFRNMGFLYQDMSMPKLAYESFSKVTVCDPRNPRAWCELGDVLSKPGHRAKLLKTVNTNVDLAALKAYAKALKLDKRYVRAYHGTAMAWFRLGKYQKSLEYLNKCLDIDKHNGDTLLLRSKVHGKLGNYGSASKDRYDACVTLKSRLCEAK